MSTCAAYGCFNKPHKRIPGITFHKFPGDPRRRAEWIRNVRRLNFVPSKYSQLCSDHFTEDMIDRSSLAIVRLKKGAIPTIFKGFPIHLQCVPQENQTVKLVSGPAPAETKKAVVSEDAPRSSREEPPSENEASGDDTFVCETEDAWKYEAASPTMECSESDGSNNVPEEVITIPERGNENVTATLNPNILRVLSKDFSGNIPPIRLLNSYTLSAENVEKYSIKQLQAPPPAPPTPSDKELDLQLKLERSEQTVRRYRVKVKSLQQLNRRLRVKVQRLEKKIKDLEDNRTTDEDVSEGDISESEVYEQLLRHQNDNDDASPSSDSGLIYALDSLE